MQRRVREAVVVVVPTLAKSEETDQPAILGPIAGIHRATTP